MFLKHEILLFSTDWVLPRFFQYYAINTNSMNDSGLLNMMDLTFINIVR